MATKDMSMLISDLKEYIQDELSDSEYYKALANYAPTARARLILMDFSNDEAVHAQNFMRAYKQLTGKEYIMKSVAQPQIPDYKEAIKQRILAETKDYKKYGEQYLKAQTPYLKDIFFMTRTDEAVHAMRMPLLLAEMEQNY